MGLAWRSALKRSDEEGVYMSGPYIAVVVVGAKYLSEAFLDVGYLI
jgi:hypothetical protein